VKYWYTWKILKTLYIRNYLKTNPPMKNLITAKACQDWTKALLNSTINNNKYSKYNGFFRPNLSAICPVRQAPRNTPTICIVVIVEATSFWSHTKFHWKISSGWFGKKIVFSRKTSYNGNVKGVPSIKYVGQIFYKFYKNVLKNQLDIYYVYYI
jgi:hypothetical protein